MCVTATKLTKPMKLTTNIHVNDRELRIDTAGFGFNTLHRHSELHAEMWQWHEAVAHAISDHHASVMGAIFPCPDPTVEEINLRPPAEPESPFEPYRGEGWCDDLLPPIILPPPLQDIVDHLLVARPPEGPAAPGEPPEDTGDETMQGSWEPGPESELRGPETREAMRRSLLPRVVHPTMVCHECGDTELVLSHEPGEEGWYRCAGSCALHKPRVNPEIPHGFSPVSHM